MVEPRPEAPDLTTGSRPLHLWVVGVVALLWNAVGAFDYLATQFRIDFYMSQFGPEQLAYFYGFPSWAVAAWAVAVWSALAGSVALLLGARWAKPAFALSLVGMAGSSVYSFALGDGAAVMGTGGVVFTVLIGVFGLFLFLYARGLARRGVLI